jgi:hypothetical protein
MAVIAGDLDNKQRFSHVARCGVDDFGVAQLHCDIDPVVPAFEARKRQAIAAGQASPLESVAAFLIALSSQNRGEGRNPRLIAESVCRVVAALPVSFDAEVLEGNLVRLEGLGFIACDPNGAIHLHSLDRLKWLADGCCGEPPSASPSWPEA